MHVLFDLMPWGGRSQPLHPCIRAGEDICTPGIPSQRVQAPLSPGGQGLWEPAPPPFPVTALNSNCQSRGETTRGFVKTNKLKEKPRTRFLSNRNVRRDVWAYPPCFLLLKGKRKGSRERRGAGDSLLATLGTVMSSCQGDVAPVQGTWPAFVAGAVGWRRCPWCPLGWRRWHARHSHHHRDARLFLSHISLAKPGFTQRESLT